jgi:hypothetical protein
MAKHYGVQVRVQPLQRGAWHRRSIVDQADAAKHQQDTPDEQEEACQHDRPATLQPRSPLSKPWIGTFSREQQDRHDRQQREYEADYRYTWMRDAAFSLYALLRLGFTEKAEAFMQWLEERFLHTADCESGPLQIMYGIDGREDLREQELPHLEGYMDSAPVQSQALSARRKGPFPAPRRRQVAEVKAVAPGLRCAAASCLFWVTPAELLLSWQCRHAASARRRSCCSVRKPGISCNSDRLVVPPSSHPGDAGCADRCDAAVEDREGALQPKEAARMSDSEVDELGPVNYIVVEFPADQADFSGAMATELSALIERGTVRVLDLVFLKKELDGSVEGFETHEFGDGELGELRALETELAMLLAADDVKAIGAALEPGSVAAVLVWENAWAAPFASAVRRSGGQLVASGRIPIQALAAAIEADEAATTEGA